MTEEFIDVLDEKGKHLGFSKPQAEVHRKGLWHAGVHIWIYNSKGEILLQKRSLKKKIRPGKWCVAVGGHVSAGEKPREAAVREAFEELGIKLKPSELQKAGRIKVSRFLPELNGYKNEFNYVFLWKFDGKISQLKINKKEIEKMKFVSLKKYEEEISNPEKRNNYVYHKEYFSKIIKILRKKTVNKRNPLISLQC